MNCIYCGSETNGLEGAAHAIPEALVNNDQVLPSGAVCDGCNNYLGTHLDDALARHPIVALAIQTLGTPGKRGKPRKEMARLEHSPSDDPDALVRGPAQLIHEGLTSGGERRLEVSFQADPKFKMLAFRRALHHVAFNVYALQDGVDAALDSRWDGLRKYIRAPRPRESRPFAQTTPEPGAMPPLVTAVRLEGGRAELIGLSIFGTIFVVDLADSGQLKRLATAQGFTYVPRSARDPISLKFELGE